jgi:hypothetical protein
MVTYPSASLSHDAAQKFSDEVVFDPRFQIPLMLPQQFHGPFILPDGRKHRPTDYLHDAILPVFLR